MKCIGKLQMIGGRIWKCGVCGYAGLFTADHDMVPGGHRGDELSYYRRDPLNRSAVKKG